MDTVRASYQSPVISIAKIRGCVRGVSSEFVPRCDMVLRRRDPKNKPETGQPKSGWDCLQVVARTERLPHLVGRGRALEIVSARNGLRGDTAERYGYVNRALPDAELDGFVDALAAGSPPSTACPRRAKNLVGNHVSLPSADGSLSRITSFETALTCLENQSRIQAY